MGSLQGGILGRGFSSDLFLFPIHLVAQARNLAVLLYPFPPPRISQIHKAYHFWDLIMEWQRHLPGERHQNCCGGLDTERFSVS